MNHWEKVKSKVLDWTQANSQINAWKNNGLKVVFTNGCFDLLHLGHVHYLNHAAALGDKFILGLNSDSSVSQLKGNHRPLQSQESRASIMASMACIDAIIIFDEETPYELISLLKPDVLVKGGDYTADQIVGADVVNKNGGEVIILEFIPGHSTTAIEQKIKEQK